MAVRQMPSGLRGIVETVVPRSKGFDGRILMEFALFQSGSVVECGFLLQRVGMFVFVRNVRRCFSILFMRFRKSIRNR